jgi:hypothetical protein
VNNTFLDQLDLTPQERRIVVAIGLVLIVVLNFLFVWPHFSEWSKIRVDLARIHSDMEKYNKQIALDTDPHNGLQKQVAKLVRQEGSGVMDNQIQLQNTIYTQARRTGVNVGNYNPGGQHPQTNDFFEEETIKISIDSQEPQLVDFLYNIGGDPAMIRVSELDLSPQDQNRYRLKGFITLTANYAKKAPTPAPAAAPAKTPGAPAAKPPQNPVTTAKPPPVTKQALPVAPRGPPGINTLPRTPFTPGKKPPGQ